MLSAMRRLFFVTVLLLFCVRFSGQQFGGNPPSVKWRQINTDTVRIIYPVGSDSQATRVASIVHYLAANKPVSLGDQLRKVNIVLQNQTIIPNGYVQLGPFRSEFFLTPQLNNFGQGSISWTDQLALHEYRHVQQFNNFNNGLSKTMKTLFGEEGFALAINTSIPDWFYEGDAVFNETILSKQGRGRIPQFLNAYPALWVAGKNYSWMKLRNGSLKDYIPNHYDLGYLLVNYGRSKYGADFWTKVTKDASAFKGLVYPFQKAIKRYTGISYSNFIKDAFDSYKNELNTITNTAHFVSIENDKKFASYTFPYIVGDDSILFQKRSYRQRPAFYIKDKTGEHLLRYRDISIDEHYSYRNGKIVYAAYENDTRWSWKDYSVLRILDIKTGEQKKLTKQSKYFTPDISADGSLVAAVKIGLNGQSELHVLSAETGAIIQQIHLSEINLFTDPKFITNDSVVVAVRQLDGHMALAIVNLANAGINIITPPSFNIIGFPCVNGSTIYFSASFGGNDNVFVFDRGEKKLFKVTDGQLGDYQVNVLGDKIVWSSFTADGYRLQTTNVGEKQWDEIANSTTDSLFEKFTVSTQAGIGDVLLDKVEHRNFESKNYKKGTNLLNFHSWRPYYEDPILTYSLYGENVLNTLQSEVYYLYNQNERTSATGFTMTYGALFPYLNVGSEYTFNRQELIGNRWRTWNQLDSRIGLSLPLQHTSGKTFKNFTASSFYVFRNELNKGFYKDSLGNTSLSYLSHAINWSQQIQRTVQDIYPRFAYSFSTSYRHAMSSTEGRQFNGNAGLFLPGFVNTHNLVINASFQERDTLNQVSFGNRFAYSRGYTGRYFSRMWKVGANYHFPLMYPDWGFGNMLYLQRVRANLFYDYTKIYSRDKTLTRDQRSVGAEMFVDTKWWNQYPLTFGFRISKLMDQDQFDGFKGTRVEFILPVSIIPK